MDNKLESRTITLTSDEWTTLDAIAHGIVLEGLDTDSSVVGLLRRLAGGRYQLRILPSDSPRTIHWRLDDFRQIGVIGI